MKNLLILLVASLALLTACSNNQAQQKNYYQQKLQAVTNMWQTAKAMHPAWQQLYPVCVVQANTYYLYQPTATGSWQFKQSGTIPNGFPKNIMAAFPLPFANYQMACIVDEQVLDSAQKLVTVFHEFVHCYQFNTCEQALKKKLELGRRGIANNDGMWELNYPYPYNDMTTGQLYLNMVIACQNSDSTQIKQLRASLHNRISALDWEYQTWQEFKEGSARWLENRLNKKLGFTEARSGKTLPLNRVNFYEGGDKLIRMLTQNNPSLGDDFTALWQAIYDYK